MSLAKSSRATQNLNIDVSNFFVFFPQLIGNGLYRDSLTHISIQNDEFEIEFILQEKGDRF